MITRAYRVVSVRAVDPGDVVYTASGPIQISKIEATADGVKLSGKRAAGVRAIPIEVKRGADVVLCAGHGVLDDLETVLADRLCSTTVDDGVSIGVGTGVITVTVGDVCWTIPRRGHEDEWLNDVMPPPAPKTNATVTPPVITATAAVDPDTAAAGPTKTTPAAKNA